MSSQPDDLAPLDAYALLSKPTLDLTDAEVAVICEDLRRRRKAYISGEVKADKPKAERSKRAAPDAEAKRANTLALLNSMNLGDLKL